MSTGLAATPGARVGAVHDLRGLAAMAVVVHHALAARSMAAPEGLELDLGQPAVMIFFVISGFVMVHACGREGPAPFAARRVIRVVPLYWLATLAFYALALRKDVAAGAPFARADELLASLLFVPHWNATSPDRVWPILVPGWTLNYEMFFFALFGLGLVVRDLRLTAALLAALACMGLAVDWGDPRLLTWTSPLLMLFGAGMILASAWRRPDFGRAWPAAPVGLMVMAGAAAGLIAPAWTDPAFGLAAVMIVAGALAMERRRPAFGSHLPQVLGDASYAIYLSHTLVLIALGPVLRALPLDGPGRLAVALPTAVLACALAGIAVHLVIERPMTRALRRLAERAGPSRKPRGALP